MAQQKQKGIIPILAALTGPLIGLLDKRKRDEATPPMAGKLRDAGILVAGGASASAIATQAGQVPWETIGLEPTQVVWINLIGLIAGAVMYLTGIGKTNEQKKATDEKH